MEFYAKGQLSFLILTCMQERDYYGLDIISEISNRSNGRINLKKPSVYSNLTRMEKQGYISSYLKSSDFGPNRKYYSLTEKGRGFYQELKTYFDNNGIDVFRDFHEDDVADVADNSPAQVIQAENIQEAISVNLNNENDFFDFSSLNTPSIATEESIETENMKDEEIIENNLIEENVVEKESVENIEESLSTQSIDDYNRRLYDISKDINKIKRKRSFADDQISMTATAPLIESNEKIRSNIEEFKNSILENREKYQESRKNSFDFFKQRSLLENQKQENTPIINKKAEPEKDDGVFITTRIEADKIERPKKIQPPKLKIVSENTKDVRLPAPNRDKSIDPSHREILNKLYTRTKDVNTQEVREDAIYDYNDLKDYYKSQSISFSIYQKSKDRTKHNTNKLYLINSLLVFVLAALVSSLIFIAFKYTGLINTNTNFMFIVLPILLVFDIGYKLYNYRYYSGWIPTKIKPQWFIWLLSFTLILTVVGLNFAFGMAVKPFDLFATSVVLPSALIIITLPCSYFLKRAILVKYWR